MFGKLILILLSLSLEVVAATSLDHLSFVRGCRLDDQKGAFRNFPGDFCLFQDDGTVISADDRMIRKYSSEQKVLWEIPTQVHHHMKLSPDKQRILALTFTSTSRDNAILRDEGLIVLDQSGKVLAQTSFKNIRLLSNSQPGSHSRFQFDSNKHTVADSHFNSISEIGPHKKSEISWLRPGNIIVNSLVEGIYVLTEDLKHVTQHFTLNQLSVSHSIHDVQVTPEGEILFFNNLVKDSREHPYSAVQKIDPLTKKVVFEITTSPKILFYSPVMGSVQELDDYYLFSHMTTGGYLYSKKENRITKTFPMVMDTVSSLKLTQDIKLIDAKKFFERFH